MTENETPYETRSKKVIKRLSRDPFQEHGKLPPQAIDLEEAVLGGLMLEKEAILSVAHILSPVVFYKEAHQAIYEAIQTLYDANDPIDILTVSNQLRNIGKLELAGGPFYITQLTSRIASSANVEFHAAVLKEKYLARELIKISTNTISKAFTDDTDVFDLLDETESELNLINEKSVSGNSQHISSAVDGAMQDIALTEALAKEGKILGIPTGLTELDKVTSGWQGGELIVVAGRPGMGKTAIMLHHAKAAAKAGKWVNIYSLEMDEKKLARRLLFSESDVSPDKVKSGNLTPWDWKDLEQAKQKIKALPIVIDSTPIVSLRYIRSKSRILKRKGQCDMIMIDYLQLIEPMGNKDKLREQQVAESSRYCKILAKELNVPVILLAQLNREVEKAQDKKPMLSHLRESGAVEQDADMVLFLYRAEHYKYFEDGDGNSTRGIGKIIIAKYREGSNIEIPFRYNPSLTHIGDYISDSDMQFIDRMNPASNMKPNENFDNEDDLPF